MQCAKRGSVGNKLLLPRAKMLQWIFTLAGRLCSEGFYVFTEQLCIIFVACFILKGRDTHIDFLRFVSGAHVCLMMMTMQPSLTPTKTGTACEQALHLMHQSNPTVPILLPWALAFLFCFGWQIPGSWDTWDAQCLAVGTKREGKCPVLELNPHCSFHWSPVE